MKELRFKRTCRKIDIQPKWQETALLMNRPLDRTDNLLAWRGTELTFNGLEKQQNCYLTESIFYMQYLWLVTKENCHFNLTRYRITIQTQPQQTQKLAKNKFYLFVQCASLEFLNRNEENWTLMIIIMVHFTNLNRYCNRHFDCSNLIDLKSNNKTVI